MEEMGEEMQRDMGASDERKEKLKEWNGGRRKKEMK